MIDTISRADAIEAKPEYRNEDMLDKEKSTYNKGWNDCNDAWAAIIKALPSAEQTDCTDFVNWLLEKVMDEEMWELNAVAYGEIICRKLEKLGVLEVTEEPRYYIRPSAEVEPKWTCTANFIAEQLDRLRKMTDEEKLEFIKRFFGMEGDTE